MAKYKTVLDINRKFSRDELSRFISDCIDHKIDVTVQFGSHEPDAELQKLVEKWEKRAKKKFFDAEGEKDEAGRRLIEHGATCYANCAAELKKLM